MGTVIACIAGPQSHKHGVSSFSLTPDQPENKGARKLSLSAEPSEVQSLPLPEDAKYEFRFRILPSDGADMHGVFEVGQTCFLHV